MTLIFAKMQKEKENFAVQFNIMRCYTRYKKKKPLTCLPTVKYGLHGGGGVGAPKAVPGKKEPKLEIRLNAKVY